MNAEMSNKTMQGFLKGLVTGIIAPILAFACYVLIFRQDEQIPEVLQSFVTRKVYPHVVSLSVIINLPLFFLFLKMNRESGARGILGATLLYAIYVMIIKFI